MKIYFKNKTIKKICEEPTVAAKKFGANCAKRLRTRLAELTAADFVSELVVGRPHPLKADRKGQFAINLDRKIRLIFVNYNQENSSSDLDWSTVNKILIIEIGDYHD